MMRMVVARLIVAILLGIAVGYAVGKSTAADAERGNALTMKEYIADFDHHKQELISSRVPMAGALFVGALMIVAMFAQFDRLCELTGHDPEAWRLVHLGDMNSPRALEFDEAGNLFVADTFNERIRRIEGIAAPFRHYGGIGP